MISVDHEKQHNAKQLPQRYDGRLKVTGKAKYAAEFPVSDVTYGYIVHSTIPSGTVTAIDTAAASRASGVLGILTPFNAPKVKVAGNVHLLQSTSVVYNGQPIAVVVARSLPEAMHAAGLLKISYNPATARLDFKTLAK